MSFCKGNLTTVHGEPHPSQEKGQTTMTTPLAMASSSKFPVAIAIAGAAPGSSYRSWEN